MEINGTYELDMTAQELWDSMMDTQVLTQCIPACQSIKQLSSSEYFAKVKVKIGFIPVKFNINLELFDMTEPRIYSLNAQAHGGLADAARATGTVEFVEVSPCRTKVIFNGQLSAGSALFELGQPLIQSTSKKWFEKFFKRFEIVVKENNS